MAFFTLTGDDVRNYRSVFNSWGGDSRDGLSVDDLTILMKKLLSRRTIPPNHDIKLLACDMIASIDVHGNAMSLQAFLNYMASKTQIRDIEFEYSEAFRLFDLDGNGKLSLDELKYILQKLLIDASDATIESMMKAADTDGDGNVDYEEFAKFASERH